MNAKEYEYGTDPKTGLNRQLVRDTVVIQEEMDNNPLPKAVVHLRLQTYVENEGVKAVVTDVTAGYQVVKGQISYNVNGEPLPKHIINPETGEITTPINPDTDEPYPRDNGYENIILLSKMAIPFDSVLDSGIKEYYGIE
tara:strand:- start:77 stop:496 length:420 start_codon:yes stop_codon:yes gene_type:complete